jgi:hypothetical protein
MGIRTAFVIAAFLPLIFAASPGPAQENQAGGLQVAQASLRPGSVGTQAAITLQIRNTTQKAMQDPHVLCQLIDRDGATLGSKTQIIHETFAAGETRTLAHLDFGGIDQKVSSIKCMVVAG